MKYVLVLFYLLFDICSYAQPLDDFFKNKHSYYNLVNIREYYITSYESHEILEAAKKNSQLLKNKDEYIKVLEEKNAKLGKLLDVSETQKRSLKKRNQELQNTISELLENNTWQDSYFLV